MRFKFFIYFNLFLTILLFSPLSKGAALIIPANATIALDHPQQYVVKKGDTLWDIASLFLTRPWQVGNVWQHTNYPVFAGDVVSLVSQGQNQVLQIKHQRKVRLSPNTRISRKDRVIDKIPVNKIRQFFNRPQIISAEQRQETAYIVAVDQDRLLVGSNDSIYVRGLDEDALENERYIIVRQGVTYKDPSNNDEVLAYEAIYLGEAHLVSAGDPATLLINSVQREVLIGDLLIPLEQDILAQDFYPSVPFDITGARIIAVVDGVSHIGQYQVVVLNRGSLDDIERSNILSVYQSGRIIVDTVKSKKKKEQDILQLPEKKSGILLVFKVFDRVSYALVMRSNNTIHILDKVGLP